MNAEDVAPQAAATARGRPRLLRPRELAIASSSPSPIHARAAVRPIGTRRRPVAHWSAPDFIRVPFRSSRMAGVILSSARQVALVSETDAPLELRGPLFVIRRASTEHAFPASGASANSAEEDWAL